MAEQITKDQQEGYSHWPLSKFVYPMCFAGFPIRNSPTDFLKHHVTFAVLVPHMP